LRSLADSIAFKQAAEFKADSIVEVDLSTNELDNVEALDVFPNLESLILDHNKLESLISFPYLTKLETLSLSHNGMEEIDTFLLNASQKFPGLKHLNVMKNPMNPESGSKYAEFRAAVKMWMPALLTLDTKSF